MQYRKRILIVDDDLAIRSTFRYVFAGDQWDVNTVGTGEEALLQLQQEGCDIVFLDYRLPGMNGLELAHALKEKGIRVPIVIISAHMNEEAMSRARKEAGVVEVLSKPVDPWELRALASKEYSL